MCENVVRTPIKSVVSCSDACKTGGTTTSSTKINIHIQYIHILRFESESSDGEKEWAAEIGKKTWKGERIKAAVSDGINWKVMSGGVSREVPSS